MSCVQHLLMAYGYRLRRTHNYGMTTLELSHPDFELELKLVSELGKRERRVIARSLLTLLKPWIRYFQESALGHGHRNMISKKSRSRGIRDFQSEPLSTDAGKYGFEIRMLRLKLGYSQVMFAKLLGIQRSHLSDLEREQYLPSLKTRRKIESVLKEHAG